MKRFFQFGFILITILMFSLGKVDAQDRASAEVRTTIIVPLTATETFQLNFGRFYPGSQGGTLVISPEGNVTTTASVASDASPRNPGSFLVTGEADAAFSITLPNTPATLTNANNTSTMQVSNWVSSPQSGDATAKLSGGAQTVWVGATLQVGSLDENPKGIYKGSFQITFAYN
jgi:hypothetical protein